MRFSSPMSLRRMRTRNPRLFRLLQSACPHHARQFTNDVHAGARTLRFQGCLLSMQWMAHRLKIGCDLGTVNGSILSLPPDRAIRISARLSPPQILEVSLKHAPKVFAHIGLIIRIRRREDRSHAGSSTTCLARLDARTAGTKGR